MPPAVCAVISSLLGLALVLYGGVFHHHFSSPATPASTAGSERELHLYRALLAAGVPLLLLGVGLWGGYLYRSGRCRHCWLCPAARKRRRLRNNFQTQVRPGSSQLLALGTNVMMHSMRSCCIDKLHHFR